MGSDRAEEHRIAIRRRVRHAVGADDAGGGADVAGARKPAQLTADIPSTPASFMVGTSGNDAARSGAVIPIARNRPSMICAAFDAVRNAI